jgi:hypothetical protein
MTDSRELVIPKKAPESPLQSSVPTHIINAKFFNTRNLSIAVTGIVFSIALLKADSKDVPKIVELIANSPKISFLGWVIAVIILIAAVVLMKIMCKIYDKEIERLVKERDQLQKQLLEKNGEKI